MEINNLQKMFVGNQRVIHSSLEINDLRSLSDRVARSVGLPCFRDGGSRPPPSACPAKALSGKPTEGDQDGRALEL